MKRLLLHLVLAAALLVPPPARALPEGVKTKEHTEALLIKNDETLLTQAVKGDAAGAMNVNLSARTGAAQTKVQCSSTVATPLPATPLPGRRSIWIGNYGPNSIWICLSDTGMVTGEAGVCRKVPTGAEVSYEIGDNILLYCLADTADQTTAADTHVQEFK